MLSRYLGGVLDFTGELNRYAIAKATIRDIEEVKRCRGIAEALMGEFLQVRRPNPVQTKYTHVHPKMYCSPAIHCFKLTAIVLVLACNIADLLSACSLICAMGASGRNMTL